MQREQMIELAEIVAGAVVTALEKKGIISTTPVNPKDKPKTAYQKTEQLLFNYMGLKRIVADRKREIEEIKTYGVPQKCGGVTEYVSKGGMPQGIVLPEETAENAIRRIEGSIHEVVKVIDLIDKSLYSLRNDPYYKIIELRYFEGRTQEDIALTLNCSQVTISNNKNRLIRELALRMFPNQVVTEYLT